MLTVTENQEPQRNFRRKQNGNTPDLDKSTIQVYKCMIDLIRQRTRLHVRVLLSNEQILRKIQTPNEYTPPFKKLRS